MAESIALKGGTAINLTIFNLPRLSVDIDLDYCRSIDRDDMLADREKITERIHDESKSLSGLKKRKFDKEHEQDLVQYDMARAELKGLLSEGGKITPKAWRREREQLEGEMPELRSERARACHDLAFAEVISYNRANLERIEQNESRQRNRQTDREQTTQKKRREESL